MAEEERKSKKCSNCNRLLYDVRADDETLPASIECPHCHTVNRVPQAHRPQSIGTRPRKAKKTKKGNK